MWVHLDGLNIPAHPSLPLRLPSGSVFNQLPKDHLLIIRVIRIRIHLASFPPLGRFVVSFIYI